MNKFLNLEQKNQLLEELKQERSRKYADRIRVILLLDQGKTYKSIAEYLFLDESTIANYRKRYKTGGLENLVNDSYLIKNSSLSEDDLISLSLHLEEFLYPDTKSICHFVQCEFSCEYTVSGMTKLLQRMGFSFKKAKAVPIKADLEEQKEFIKYYQQLKRRGKIYFADSTHAQYGTMVGKGWIKTGMNHSVFTHRNSYRKKLNYNGAVCLETLEVVVRKYNEVNGDAIIDLIKTIRDKNEHEQLTLVLDNASYNKCHKVRNYAKGLGVNLVYLPAYSPNLNPIERLWKFFKKKVLLNIYYESFEDFCDKTQLFFRQIRSYRQELKTLLTDNFEIMGT